MRLRDLVVRYERHISIVTIILAFVVDSLTLVRVDEVLTNVILLTYLTIAGAGIIFINLRESGRLSRLSPEAYLWLFIAVQFSFGGLFGRFLIYYSRSGSIAASWPFLALLALFLIGNELARRYYSRIVLQTSFLFLALYSFLIYAVPVALGRMGRGVFVLSSLIALAIMALFLRILLRFVPARVMERRSSLFGIVIAITVSINLLYAANVIPPLPLSLRDAGIYHSVEKRDNNYKATGEPYSQWRLFERPVVHIIRGSSLAVFSAVFAPTNFGASIAHDWQYRDEEAGVWTTVATVSFPIFGGQDKGYRGYSTKGNFTREGRWRVVVKTADGQTIGRVNFIVAFVGSTPALVDSEL